MKVIEIQKKQKDIVVKLLLTNPRSKVRIIRPDGTYIQTPTKDPWDQNCWVERMISYKQGNKLVELGEILKLKAEAGQQHFLDSLRDSLQQVNEFFTEKDYFQQPATEPEKVGKFAGYDVFRRQRDIFGYEGLLDTGMKVVSYAKPGEYTAALQPHFYVYLPINPDGVAEPDADRFFIGELQFPRKAKRNEQYTWCSVDDEIKEIVMGLAHTDRSGRDGLIEILESLKK